MKTKTKAWLSKHFGLQVLSLNENWGREHVFNIRIILENKGSP